MTTGKALLRPVAAAILGSIVCTNAGAVRLDPDGLGQALIYPYYTVRSSQGNAYNTLISVANHTSDAKAVRVRFRDGLNGREVAGFNLFLSPNDVWTGGVVPTVAGARLVSADSSCVEPPFAAGAASGDLPYLEFQNTAFNDGLGTSVDRTREGYIEMIELATLTGASAAAVTHGAAGTPANCAFVQDAANVTEAAPTGGLSGTLTLINVANGMDFTVNAEALAELTSAPFYRRASDPYPDFDSVLYVTPVSEVVADGFVYRSVWGSPVDAVSAVLMRRQALNEYILEPGTRSATDWVLTFPTKRFYAGRRDETTPFRWWHPNLGPYECTWTDFGAWDREGGGGGSGGLGVPTFGLCRASSVFSVRTSNPASPQPTEVLGSAVASAAYSPSSRTVPATSPSGYADFRVAEGRLTSNPDSRALASASGNLTNGPHIHFGVPMVGFAVRTFQNGLLSCASGTCQGNYGGIFPHKYRRDIVIQPR